MRYLDEDRVEGDDPTTLFGPHTVLSLKREDAMPHAPDLLLLSQYDPELGEVAAFEELIGSHGGLGGPQTEPFILHPTEWELDEPVPLGAPAIYRNLRRWLGTIGIDLAKTPAPVAETPPEPRPSSRRPSQPPAPHRPTSESLPFGAPSSLVSRQACAWVALGTCPQGWSATMSCPWRRA